MLSAGFHALSGDILREEPKRIFTVFEVSQMSTLALQDSELPIAADDFNALEQRVLRMVELLKSERTARAAADQRVQEQGQRIQEQEAAIRSLEESGLNAEQRVVTLEEKLSGADKKIEELNAENAQSASQLATLEKERETVRARVERLLKQLDEVPA
jgi:chromosome segregation ATPase